LTLDIPETLHRAIKGKAAIEGVAMVDMLRELLEEKYGNL
jgi:predicted DNA binding CopG/RHH family protein